MAGNLDITGYAIVSDDDKIAAADGMTPVSLRNEKDWELYQRAQERRTSSCSRGAATSSSRISARTLRLVVSREAAGLEQRPDSWWWDPRRTTWEEVAARLLPSGGRVAVGGGQVVFDLFLMIGFDGFHLSRAHGVKLPGGRSVFSACDAGVSAAGVLEQHGLSLSKTIPLDPAHGVEMTVWRRAGLTTARPMRAGRFSTHRVAPAGRLNGVITCTCDGAGGGPCGNTRCACITTRQAERTSALQIVMQDGRNALLAQQRQIVRVKVMADEHPARTRHRLEGFHHRAVAAADGIGGDDVRVGGERLSRQRAGRPVDAEPFADLDNAEVGVARSEAPGGNRSRALPRRGSELLLSVVRTFAFASPSHSPIR